MNSNKILQRLFLIGLAILTFVSVGCAQVIVTYLEALHAPLPNPFKGYAPYADTFYPDPAIPQSLVYDDVTWKALEPDAAGDLDQDGDVDAIDLAEFAAAFHTAAGELSFNPAADIDASTRVNKADLSMWLSGFGL